MAGRESAGAWRDAQRRAASGKEKLSELGKRRSGVLASLGKFRSLYQALPPYQQREGIRLVIANVKISEDAM